MEFVIEHLYLIDNTVYHSQLIQTFVTVGDYDVTQLTEAQVAWFNVWSYHMSEEQLNNLSCNSIGDAANQNGMQLSGTSKLTYETFYCKGEHPSFEKKTFSINNIPSAKPTQSIV